MLLAEQIGTLASIARGPFVMQCAVGGGEEQFRVFDTSLRERATRFEATLDIVRALCRGETVTVTDGPWKIDRARIAPVPPEPLEVWIGAAAPRAVDRAARLGDAFLIGPEATPPEVAALVAELPRGVRAPRSRRRRASPCAATSTSRATDAEAASVADPIVERRLPRASTRRRSSSADRSGSPTRSPSLGDAGCTDVIVRHLADDQAAVLRSFEQLASVRTRLR